MHLREKRNRKQNTRFLGDEWEEEADFLSDKNSSSGDGVDQCGPRGKRNRKQNGRFLGDEWVNEAGAPSDDANSDGSSQLYTPGYPETGAVVHSIPGLHDCLPMKSFQLCRSLQGVMLA